uniref:Uncharacterized protein n=1 Tax=Aegilops tauschii subsp. strangulata TaxID=200361 RepID=A0A453BQ51_AEGTS
WEPESLHADFSADSPQDGDFTSRLGGQGLGMLLYTNTNVPCPPCTCLTSRCSTRTSQSTSYLQREGMGEEGVAAPLLDGKI